MSTRTLMVLSGLLAVIGCAATTDTGATDTTKNAGITVVAGTWAYNLTESIPLPTAAQPRCTATVAGTAAVSSSGAYTVTFPALSCSGCTMTASTSGTISSTAVNGSVTASIAGSGCSSEQPTPSPASVTGTCDSTSCSVATANGDSYGVSYTLTPPG